VAVLQWRVELQPGDDELRRHSGWRPPNLRKPGFAPTTIVDVGVANGTPSLYAAFPDAYCVLIEPLREFEQRLLERTRDRPGELVQAAAGARSGTATIEVDLESPFFSSVHAPRWRPPLPAASTELRQVPVVTLDGLWEDRGWTPPFGLKIDTEGHELEVLEGSTRLLGETEFVIAEVSVAERFEGSYSFAEFVRFMDEQGFRLYDILFGRKVARGETLYIDAMFVP
jgi:FkbM family methyltransferase